MDILKYSEIDLAETIKRSEEDVNKVLDIVSDILNNVKVNKDKAIREYTEKFDGVTIENLKVSKDEIKEAYETLDDELLVALKQAASNIEKFHKKQIPSEWEMEVNPGIVAGQIVRPINSAGCYIPGGRAAYPSSILMTVIPAKIAGVEKVVCVTPPQKDGKILDAILVILLPQPYKLAGAAVATSMSQVVGGVVPLFYFGRKNSSILQMGKTRFDIKALIKACVNGSSEFMSNVAMSVVGMLYNIQLLKYAGENGVAAYGVMMYVSMIFSAAYVGYSIGSAPIISYHDGAQNHDELKSLLQKSLRMIGVFGIAMTVSAEVLATPLAKVFVGYDTELMELTVSGFRIFALSFVFMGFAIFASGFFTALNDGVTSAVISFLRTFVFQCATVILLPLVWGIDGVWISIVVAEVIAVIISTIFIEVKKKKYHY